MEHNGHLIYIFLVLLTTVNGTMAISRQSVFNKLKEGQLITGKVDPELSARSNTHCSAICLSTDNCKAYKYKNNGPENCLLIISNTTTAEGQLITTDNSYLIYEKNLCKNGAEHVRTDDGYKCKCVDGYLGSHCEEEDNCFNGNSCKNGATCVDGDDTYTCKCVPGYLGNHCGEEDNCFNGNNCMNGTKCLDGDDGYTCVCSQDSGGTWTPPSGWNGPNPALYISFDIMDGLVFMEGTQQQNYAPLVSGQVNCAWSLDRTKNQWIDLGFQTETCMTRPDTCGAAGGAISFWMNVIDCPSEAGVLSAYKPGTRTDQHTGFLIYCETNSLLFEVCLPSGVFQEYPSKPSGWTHIVLNYLGPKNGQGIRIFINGQEVASHTSKYASSSAAGDGRIIVGKWEADRNQNYASIQIDELLFFNKALSTTDIIALNN